MRTCLVLMPFSDENLNRHYVEVVRPAVIAAGYGCSRVDEISGGTFQIIRNVVEAIENADVVLANLTSLSVNVFYELGVGHSFGSNVLMVVHRDQIIPFDVGQYHIQRYDVTPEGNDALKSYIRSSLTDTSWMQQPNNPIQANSVRLRQLLRFTPIRASKRYDNSEIARQLYEAIQEFSPFTHSSGVAYVIAIAGPVAIGKSTFSKDLASHIEEVVTVDRATVVPLDAYVQSRSRLAQARIPNGYDDTNWDLQAARRDIEALVVRGESLQLRPFDHVTGIHSAQPVGLGPAKYVILDGVISMHEHLAPFVNVKVFICGRNIRAEQNLRIKVAYHERSYELKEAIARSEREIRDYRSYLLPKRSEADVWLVAVDDSWQYVILFEDPAWAM